MNDLLCANGAGAAYPHDEDEAARGGFRVIILPTAIAVPRGAVGFGGDFRDGAEIPARAPGGFPGRVRDFSQIASAAETPPASRGLFELELLDPVANLIAVQPEHRGRAGVVPVAPPEGLNHQRAFELLQIDAGGRLNRFAAWYPRRFPSLRGDSAQRIDSLENGRVSSRIRRHVHSLGRARAPL